MVLKSFIGIAFSLQFNSKQAAFLNFLLQRVDTIMSVFLVDNGNKVMTEKFSFHNNSDFCHEISCTSKRIVVAFCENIRNNGSIYYSATLQKKL